MAVDIRNIFNEYFIENVHNPLNYNMTFNYCNYFEELYQGYETNNFEKETRHVMELKKKINKLRKEIKENIQPINNKMKLIISESSPSYISKKVKYTLSNNLKCLNVEQMKGIVNILHDYINVESDRIFEFDIEKIPTHKIKELSKYVNRCLKEKKRIYEEQEYVRQEINIKPIVKPQLAIMSDSDSLSSDDESDDV